MLLGAAVLTTIAAACSDTSTRPAQRTLSPGTPSANTYQGSDNKLCKYGPAGTGPYVFQVSTEGYGTVLGTASSEVEGGWHTYRVEVPVNSCISFYQNTTLYNESVNIVEIDLPVGVTFDHATCSAAGGAACRGGASTTINYVHTEPLEEGPVIVSFYNTGTPVVGTQGCTPGFWKNSPGSWPPTGLHTTDHYNDVFGVTAFGSTYTLMDALKGRGGGAIALGRASTAALLNTLHGGVNYPLTSAQVIAAVQAAFATGGDIEGTKNLLDGYNNLGCPLANDNSFR